MLIIEINEDSGAAYLARIKRDGANIVKADLGTIAYKVFDVADGSKTNEGTVTISTSVFDTLQTGGGWTRDATGYNFRHAPPAAAFPNGGKLYQLEYLFTPVAGEQWFQTTRVRTKSVFTS